MSNLQNRCFCLFGNPVSHSLSPVIHKIFSKQINIKYFYSTILTPKKSLSFFLKKFFSQENNVGANVTLPFKKSVIKYVDFLSDRAKISESINTLKKIDKKFLVGDNTDGIGILYDLKRLNFLKKNFNILVIGAGGASYGIIPYLMYNMNKVYVYNRTHYKSYLLVKKFSNVGEIFCLKKNELKNYNFNLIINATSSGIYGQIPDISSSIISENVYCYDLYFKKIGYTPFLQWCKKHGSLHVQDGIGMLVSQAAYSCLLWNKKLPNIENSLKSLKNSIKI
ncbi:shikimate dehydrogenase [Buchnera aphidicola (Chaitoregma tattakana)]|uniref:shikimate dehydrogenase n=1 Tax=Buchnera aphidicola TaxID=9 RepID=UPI0031B8A644